jgi:hypothetical protein
MHHCILWFPAGLFLLGALLTWLLLGFSGALAWFGHCFAILRAIAFLGCLIDYCVSKFTITTRRVILKSGMGTSLDLVLGKVEGVEVQRGLVGLLFGFGFLLVTGTGVSKQQYGPIAQPEKFRDALQHQIALSGK